MHADRLLTAPRPRRACLASRPPARRPSSPQRPFSSNAIRVQRPGGAAFTPSPLPQGRWCSMRAGVQPLPPTHNHPHAQPRSHPAGRPGRHLWRPHRARGQEAQVWAGPGNYQGVRTGRGRRPAHVRLPRPPPPPSSAPLPRPQSNARPSQMAHAGAAAATQLLGLVPAQEAASHCTLPLPPLHAPPPDTHPTPPHWRF